MLVLAQEGTEVVVGFGVVGPDADGFAVGSHGLVQLALA